MWGHGILDRLSRWGTRQKILAAMLGTLVAVAMTAVIAMSLAPPNMCFYIQDPSLQMQDGMSSTYSSYNFSLVAENTGRRMKAHYSALQTEIWINATLWQPAEIDPNNSLVGQEKVPQQPMSNSTAIPGSAEYFEYDQTIKPGVTPAAEDTWPNCTVVVMARVLFSYGIAYTRPYSIRVACHGINFRGKTPKTTKCTA